jgi:uncharacterized protein YjbI with pentapeptide repeats
MITKVQIKTFFGKVLFEFEKEDNTVKDTLIEAVDNFADLRGAYLQGAYLQGADLQGASLTGAYLQGAYLQGADLQGADLQGAYLQGAYLQGAYLQGAYLRGAKGKELVDLKKFFWIVPEEGSFIGWKKCINAIVKLKIPAKAKRTSNIINRKCRAEFVKVLGIWDLQGNPLESASGMHNINFIYRVGETIYPDRYDGDWTNDCSNGIHFFLTKQEAEEWQ